MQISHFTLSANRRPETLERLLRVVRHRGFEVITLNVETQNDQLALQFSVQSERPLDLLIHQLVKLPDVIQIQ